MTSSTLTVALQDEAGNPVTAGYGYWDVDNSRVARVTPNSSSFGARITALHAGTAHVTVYAGGPSASQTIKVTVPATGTCLP